MEPPYIGVSGAYSQKNVDDILSAFEDNGLNLKSDHKPSINLLVSYKNVDFDIHPDSRRHPPLSNIPSMLEKAKGKSLTAIHYNTRRENSLAEDIGKVFTTGNIYDKDLCNIVQLNLPQPPLDEVKKIKKDFPKMKIIYQLSRDSMKDKTRRQLVNMLRSYPLDYVLIDSSRGSATEFEIANHSEIYKKLIHLGNTLGIAGGLNGRNVGDVVKRFEQIIGNNRFSIDAEGKLRMSAMLSGAPDDMEPYEMRRYIEEAARAFKSS